MVKYIGGGRRGGKVFFPSLSNTLNSSREQSEQYQLPRARMQCWCGTLTQSHNLWILFCSVELPCQVLHD